MHDVSIVSVPLFTIFGGLFFKNRAIPELKSEMKAQIKELRSETRARFDRVDDRLSDIYRVIGEHEGRLQALQRQA